MNWTTEQLMAINKEGSNIIVSAGAGSGKTAVLSERVLRKVKEGVDIRDILILTFTNEAAGEMKNRIRKKIASSGLNEQLEYIDSAYITTFDAYALSVVKKYHTLLGISKEITIIDSSIIDLEKRRILDEIFLEYYTSKNSLFLKLIDDFTTRDDEQIKEAILRINASLDLKYDKEEYLSRYLERFYSEENISELTCEYFIYIKELCEELESDFYLLADYLDEKAYTKIYDVVSKYFGPKKYDDLYRLEQAKIQFRNIPEEAVRFKDRIKELLKEIDTLTKYSEEELKEQILSTRDYVDVIIEIILELDKRLFQYKKEHESFEFIDIAKMAIRIVRENSNIRDELKNKYNEILVDEYQDTNDLQEMFINEIENNNVYMVGDIKQSIYRFRNANPNIFKEKYENYAKHLNGEKIDLLKNFRSRKEVLDNINLIFNILMSLDYGGVDYAINHEMVYGNLSYIQEGKTDYDYNMNILQYDDDESDFSKTEIEAFTIAQDIKSKIQSHYQVYDFDLKSKRDISYQDFCIILDRGTDMPLYKKIFEYLGIPMDVYKDSDLVISEDLSIIRNIVNLIVAINEKDNGVKVRYSFVSIARSFIGGLTDQEILNYLNNNTFYDSEIYKTCSGLAKNIESKTIGILVEEIIDAFSFYEKLIKVGNVLAGIKRLEYLIDLANNAEKLGFTIEDFLKYLDEVITSKKEIRYKEAQGLGDCVKLMNIHKSKGLEFPICYFAGFKKDFNLRDIQSRFLFDSKYGILTPYFKEGIGTTILKTLIKNRVYQEEISEKIRLFYVALTRSKEQIIIVLPKPKYSEYQKGVVDNKIASKFRSFYDFMSAMAINLNPFTKVIDLNKISLTKDYNVSIQNNNYTSVNETEKIDFQEINIDIEKIQEQHASKVIQDVITKKEAKTLEFGTHMHEFLEKTDFTKPSNNKHVQALVETFNFSDAIIYQELEFYFDINDKSYHGIIDLMLEYTDEIKIIDYKLKNIEDEGYIKQLKVYYDYVTSVSNKPVHLYLYSILDNQVKELEVINN